MNATQAPAIRAEGTLEKKVEGGFFIAGAA